MDRPGFIWALSSATLYLLTTFEFCAGVDTLGANQTLADGEVLISAGQIFELGFFSPGSSTTRFLGIWYKATPDIVVWVANRDNPIKGSQGFLALAGNGTLVLSSEQRTIIWSLNSSRVASSPILQLQDNGNLILADKQMASSQQSYMWQSFDYLGDTRLPGTRMVQDPDTGVNTYLTSWKSADDPSSFDLQTIAAATNSFSQGNMIGEGGFGPVYKGNLSGEQVIAVKRMLRTSGQGHEEFKNEVNLIAKLQHRNLIRILGCCTDGEEKMLIYEYMHNKSLDYFIFGVINSLLFCWKSQNPSALCQVILACVLTLTLSLHHLHHDSRLKVIHRDLKTSNILLDDNLNAKISDFGLARMFEEDQTTARTKRVVGTYGYMAPEYAFEGKFSIKSDIFSLGVVVLEIVSGKKNRGLKQSSHYQNLLEEAWLLWKENRELELIDPCCKNSYMEFQVKRCIQVGLLCVQNAVDERPVMSSVLLMLSTEDTVLPQPKKPGFFLRSSSSCSERNALENGKSGSGMITMSDVEPR